MISSFQTIGEHLLKQKGYYDTDDINAQRKILLFYQSLIPKPKFGKNGELILNGKTICLNFNLEEETFEFKVFPIDLSEDQRENFLALKLGSSKDRKKFLCTNNIATFYSSIFKESLEYISSKLNNDKSKEWFDKNINREYEEFLKRILRIFYIDTGKRVVLIDKDKLVEDQKAIYNSVGKILTESRNKKEWNNFLNQNYTDLDSKNVVKLNEEIWTRVVNKIFWNEDSPKVKDIPNIVLVTFDDKTIFEVEDGKYSTSYVNLCYYDLMERFFIENGKDGKLCHICKKKKEITHQIPFSMKFYGITNELYFENLSRNNAYKSFSICKTCLFEILTGMKFVEAKLRDNLFDLHVYIIPRFFNDTEFNEKFYKQIIRILSIRKSEYKTDIDRVREILKKANRKTFEFDFLFYHAPTSSQEFNILRMISNVEANILIKKLSFFDSMTEKYKLNLLTDQYGDNSLTLSDLRYYLFPSVMSENKEPDFKTYGKDLLSFLESFLKNNNFNYTRLISRFVKIFRKRLYRDKLDNLSPFKMVLALTIFDKLNQLRNGGNMEKGNFVSDIFNEDYRKFFETHSKIYGNNAYRQGLFLLGTVISKIIYAQKEKKSNFLKKINFEGISTRRIPVFVNLVRDFFDIYKKDIYEEKGIWGNIMDRLQGIDNSDIRSDEVVFYILTGISFADYLGIKKGMEKNYRGVEK